jgi:hypothetical protein
LQIEYRPGGNPGRVPVHGTRVVCDGDEGATHAFGAGTDTAKVLGVQRNRDCNSKDSKKEYENGDHPHLPSLRVPGSERNSPAFAHVL